MYLEKHGMVNYGPDLVVMGGFNATSNNNNKWFGRLSVENGKFKLEKMMNLKLRIPRDFIAMTVPDDLGYQLHNK